MIPTKRSPFVPNINAVVNEQIRRLARREITANTKAIRKAAGHYRRDIAALKRQVAQLLKEMASMRKRIPQDEPIAAPEDLKNARLRIDGLKGHRARLGLSAKDYGKLMGVSGLTIYNWEAGKSKPRRSQLPRIVAVRGIGKREAMRRLGMGDSKSAASTPNSEEGPKGGTRGKFNQTAEQMILSLLKGTKSLTRQDFNAAWKKEGRAGTSDVTLGLMVKAKKLKRTKVKGQRGTEYCMIRPAI
jgi:DNA-binding transcriptional regulator YiaG